MSATERVFTNSSFQQHMSINYNVCKTEIVKRISSGGVVEHQHEGRWFENERGVVFLKHRVGVYSKGVSHILQGSMDAALTPSPEII